MLHQRTSKRAQDEIQVDPRRPSGGPRRYRRRAQAYPRASYALTKGLPQFSTHTPHYNIIRSIGCAHAGCRASELPAHGQTARIRQYYCYHSVGGPSGGNPTWQCRRDKQAVHSQYRHLSVRSHQSLMQPKGVIEPRRMNKLFVAVTRRW